MERARLAILFLIIPVLRLTEGFCKAQPATAAFVSDVTGVWLLNGNTTLRGAQAIPERGVISFSSRQGLEPAKIVIRDLQGKLIGSRECAFDGCVPSPLVVPELDRSGGPIPDAASFQALFARVMNLIFSKPAHPVNAASRGASCRDGIAWQSDALLNLTDLLWNGDSGISTLQFRKFGADPASSVDLTVARGDSGWRVLLQPGLYDVACARDEHVWALVVNAADSAETLKKLSGVRQGIASWQDEQDEAGYQRFIRGYLDFLSSGASH